MKASELDICACTIASYPRAFINKRDEAILIKLLTPKRHRNLVEMYLAYRPRNSFHGLPPIDDDACERWATGHIKTGVNLIALSFDHGVIGHGAMFPIDSNTCELLVVVAPNYQNTGIGTELVRCIIQLSHELNFHSIWLSVEAFNTRATHVYKKCGFETLTLQEDGHVEMGLDLEDLRAAVNVHVSEVMGREAAAVDPEMRCSDAAKLFIENEISSVPVVNTATQVVGILSETDLMQPASFRKRVGEVMTRDVITVGEGYNIEKIIPLFHSKKPRCVPVVNSNRRLTGVISRKDILAHYQEHFEKSSGDEKNTE